MRILKSIISPNTENKELVYDKKEDELEPVTVFEFELLLNSEEMRLHREDILEFIPVIISNGIEIYLSQVSPERVMLCGVDVVGSYDTLILFRTYFDLNFKKLEDIIKTIAKKISEGKE